MGQFNPNAPAPYLTGVVLSVVPGDASLGAQVMRTSDNGAGGPASSAAVVVAWMPKLPAAGMYLVDPLPLDGAVHYYQGQAFDPTSSLSPSAWTAWTSGAPTRVVSGSQQAGPLKGAAVYPVRVDVAQADGSYNLASPTTLRNQPTSALYLPTTQALIVGTSGAPSVIPKSIAQSYAGMMPNIGGTTGSLSPNYWSINNGFLQGLTTGNARTDIWEAPLVFPPGVTLTKFAATLYRASTAALESVSVTLERSGGPVTGPVGIALLGNVASSWETVSAVVSQVVTSSQQYSVRVSLHAATSSDGVTLYPGYWGCSVDYQMPDYAKSL